MASRMEKLMFTVGLINKASGPASKIAADFDNINNRAISGMAKVGAGAAGLFATGYALQSLLAPAIEMDRAIGEVRSLGVRESALKQLEKTALKTSMALGENAADIVRSAYDIQSAIGGLSDNELSRFTAAGAVLAKGTKSDAATITDYMGTMYGIFQSTAEKMGKGQWVEKLSGQTAVAVQMFKTTGAEMAGAFSRLGSNAESSGVSMTEQMAVLGTLQATMSGSEAGTKYSQFLANVGKAQDSLGLKFTDSQNRMLPMVDILNQIKGKFGETLDESEKLQLKKAFGSQQAMDLVTGLIGKTDSLTDSISQLGKTKGMEQASKMAKDIADPWERMQAAGTAVKTVFGRVLQPVLVPLVNQLTDGMATVTSWTEKFPNLTRVVGMATLGIMALVATVSAFAIIGGVAQLAMAGWGAVMMITTGFMKAFQAGVAITKAVMFLFSITTWLGAGALTGLKAGLLTTLPAIWAFTTALLANPITWIVLGVGALIAGLILLAVHWDAVKAVALDFINDVFGNFSEKWQQMRGFIEDNFFLSLAFAPLLAVIDLVTLLVNAFKKIPEWWQGFKSWLSNLNPFQVVGSGIDWLIRKINLIPGVNIKSTVPSLNETPNTLGESNSVRVGARDGGLNRESIVPVGGLQQSISNNRGTTIEKMEINTTGSVNGYQLQDELLMAGG